MKYYLIIEGGKIVRAERLPPEGVGVDYTCWDMAISGNIPEMNINWKDTRGYAEKRKCAYRMEFDSLWGEYQGMILDEDYTQEQVNDFMRIKRNIIKAKFPKF